MNRRAGFLWMTVLLLFAGIDQEAGAEEEVGRWAVGLRGGGAFLSQELDLPGNFKGKTGPIVSGGVLYEVNDLFSLGFDVEWEKHRVKALGFDVGDETTFSLIPTVAWHGFGPGRFSPYSAFGLGLNINSFHRSSPPQISFIDNVVTPEDVISLAGLNFSKVANTLAVKIGFGADYFLTRHLAANAEVGWKLNEGEIDVCTASGCRSGRWNASVATALLGIRYYF